MTMPQVQVNMDDVTITLGNKGVVLKIWDNNDRHIGDLRIGRATVEWMKGRTRDGNGIKLRVYDLIELIEKS